MPAVFEWTSRTYLKTQHRRHGRKGAAVVLARTVRAQRRQMRGRAVALVRGKAVLRKCRVDLGAPAVAVHLGQNRCGRDGLDLGIAIDDGFAPVDSLIEHAIAVDAAESIALYWASSQPGGQYLPNQCRAWAAALDEFSYLPLAVDDLLAALAAHAGLAGSDVFLAGAAERVEPLAAALLAGGVPRAQLHVEAL